VVTGHDTGFGSLMAQPAIKGNPKESAGSNINIYLNKGISDAIRIGQHRKIAYTPGDPPYAMSGEEGRSRRPLPRGRPRHTEGEGLVHASPRLEGILDPDMSSAAPVWSVRATSWLKRRSVKGTPIGTVDWGGTRRTPPARDIATPRRLLGAGHTTRLAESNSWACGVYRRRFSGEQSARLPIPIPTAASSPSRLRA
jgi:hypothetical protein